MPLYSITAKREIFYEFKIEAESEKDALDEVERIELNGDVESYASDDFPLELLEVQELNLEE